MLAVCAAEGRVLISADTDFGELLAVGQLTGPSVLLLRGPVQPSAVRAGVVLANLSRFADDIEGGAIVVITEDRIRIRSRPVERG